jgi:phage portal protein BeeE
MGILTRMNAATLANPEPWLIDAFGGMPSKSGQRVNHETAMRVATVFACVRILAESIAQLPLILYRVDGDTKTRALDHPLYWLLHNQPNRGRRRSSSASS